MRVVFALVVKRRRGRPALNLALPYPANLRFTKRTFIVGKY
jgi:hypothetical protein